MPSHGGVTLILHSQYDAATIPEHVAPRDIASPNIFNVYVETLPSSQFWLSYTCHAQSQDHQLIGLVGSEARFFFFKLCLHGACVLSWGVGEEDHWQGKTIFGLFDGGKDIEGKGIVEKRGLFFPSNVAKGSGMEGEGFEVRVFRAKGRKKEGVKYDRFGCVDVGGAGEGSGVDLTVIGRKHRGERHHAYTYALIDAKDEPYVTFRYHICSKDQFSQLQRPSSLVDEDDTEADLICFAGNTGSPTSIPIALSPSIRTSSGTQSSSPPTGLRSDSPTLDTRILPVPPHKPVASSQTTVGPSSPTQKSTKHRRTDSPQITISDLDGPASVGRNRAQAVRTPSPGLLAGSEGFNVRPGTPQSQRKAAMSALLKGVMASALRRKESGRSKWLG